LLLIAAFCRFIQEAKTSHRVADVLDA